MNEILKKDLIIKNVFGFISLFINPLLLISFGLFLIIYFKLPLIFIIIFIGFDLITKLILSFLKIKQIKAIFLINNTPKSYKELLVTNEYWELKISTILIIINVISLMILFLFFSNYIFNSTYQNINFKKGALIYIIFIIIIFRIFEFILKKIKYNNIKNLKEYDNFSQFYKEYTVILKKLNLIKNLFGSIIFLSILYIIKIPLVIILIFAGVIFLIIFLSLLQLKMINKFNFNYEKTVDKTKVQHTIQNYQNEQIITAIYGIQKTFATFKQIFKPISSSVMGVGKSKYPENTLLITNYRILLIVVPVTGGSNTFNGVDYQNLNFFLIEVKLKKKVKNL